MRQVTHQEQVLRACNHAEKTCEVSFRRGETFHVCGDCWNASVKARREDRKAELAQEPRCEVPGCKHRATYTVYYTVGMCGYHLKAMQKTHQQQMAKALAGSPMAGLAMFLPVTGITTEDIIALAQGKAI
jgi:hypothetical protein